MKHDNEAAEPASCLMCGGSECLSPWGVVRVYFLSNVISLVIIALGIVLAAVQTIGWLWLCLIGYLAPLFWADLRPVMFPYVLIRSIVGGGKPSCPKCQPGAPTFKQNHPE